MPKERMNRERKRQVVMSLIAGLEGLPGDTRVIAAPDAAHAQTTPGESGKVRRVAGQTARGPRPTSSGATGAGGRARRALPAPGQTSRTRKGIDRRPLKSATKARKRSTGRRGVG